MRTNKEFACLVKTKGVLSVMKGPLSANCVKTDSTLIKIVAYVSLVKDLAQNVIHTKIAYNATKLCLRCLS
jgi:hypothetical protein